MSMGQHIIFWLSSSNAGLIDCLQLKKLSNAFFSYCLLYCSTCCLQYRIELSNLSGSANRQWWWWQGGRGWFHARTCRLHGPVPKGLWTGSGPRAAGWELLAQKSRTFLYNTLSHILLIWIGSSHLFSQETTAVSQEGGRVSQFLVPNPLHLYHFLPWIPDNGDVGGEDERRLETRITRFFLMKSSFLINHIFQKIYVYIRMS